MASFLENIFGSSPQVQQLQRFSPSQQNLQNQTIQQALGLLQGNASTPLQQQSMRRFQTQTIPSIAERFTALGAGGQNSSAFQGALGSAGAGLEQDLNAQGFQQLMQLLGHSFQPSFENVITPGQPGLFHGLAGGVGQGLGSLGGAYLSGGGNLLLQLLSLLRGGNLGGM